MLTSKLRKTKTGSFVYGFNPPQKKVVTTNVEIVWNFTWLFASNLLYSCQIIYYIVVFNSSMCWGSSFESWDLLVGRVGYWLSGDIYDTKQATLTTCVCNLLVKIRNSWEHKVQNYNIWFSQCVNTLNIHKSYLQHTDYRECHLFKPSTNLLLKPGPGPWMSMVYLDFNGWTAVPGWTDHRCTWTLGCCMFNVGLRWG